MVVVSSSEKPVDAAVLALLRHDALEVGAITSHIDAALRSPGADRRTHAAALLVAFQRREPLRLGRSDPKRWALGLDLLVETGHLDAATYVASRLADAYQKIHYFNNLLLVLRRMPSADLALREPLVDARTDVQVVPLNGAPTIVFAFCGNSHRLGVSVALVDRWLRTHNCHVVYLRDKRRIGFTEGIPALGSDLCATVLGLRQVVDKLEARHVVCLGTSAGGAAALRYAVPLHASRVLALAPITGGPEFVARMTPDLPPGAATPWSDLAPLYQSHNGVRVRILYGEENDNDRQQATRMAGLPGVDVEAVPGLDSHHIVTGLIRAGRFNQMLAWLTQYGPRATQGPARRDSVHNRRRLSDGTEPR